MEIPRFEGRTTRSHFCCKPRYFVQILSQTSHNFHFRWRIRPSLCIFSIIYYSLLQFSFRNFLLLIIKVLAMLYTLSYFLQSVSNTKRIKEKKNGPCCSGRPKILLGLVCNRSITSSKVKRPSLTAVSNKGNIVSNPGKPGGGLSEFFSST